MRRFTADKLTVALALGVAASIALLSWFSYRAITELRSKSFALAERRSREAADLMLEAITRDMSGVHTSILTSPLWHQLDAERPHEINELVASAFARYPYPDSFFLWKSGSAFDKSVFFYRTDRRPDWASAAPNTLFPVMIGHNPDTGEALLRQIERDATRTRSLSFFETRIRGVAYQVVAQLTYSDVYRERLASVVGFTVNLPWVREHYFSDLTGQVWKIGPGAEEGLLLRITDLNGQVVAGTSFEGDGTLTSQRTFDLAFFDAESELPSATGFVPEVWTIAVSGSGDTSLFRDTEVANRILALGGLSAITLAIGLFLMVRAERAGAQLTTMRSDFVSTVTHELKTPIATIKAAAETLSKERLSGMSVQDCARIMRLEIGRLGRLVENLLAYSRITDVADTYSYESVEVAEIFKNVQQDFESQLDRLGFDLEITIAPGVGSVRGDRLALRLLFDNLVDNAVKYSGAGRRVLLNASNRGHEVAIEVVDSGVGIPADELHQVTRKFVRGRGAPAGGSGLGLAIATRIAHDHGGDLRIDSSVGIGTTVTVCLPIA